MNLYLRFFWVWVSTYFKDKISSVFATSEMTFHVLPNDLDLNIHMNNGRYLSIMDLGRMDLIIRNGLYKEMLRQNSIPVLASVQMRYRIPLKPFQRYKLVTSVIYWDEKWIYMRQDFVILKGKKAGAIAASGLLKGSFYNNKKRETVPTQDLINFFEDENGNIPQPPVIPKVVEEWQDLENSHREIL